MHEHKRLGRGIELAALAEQLKAGGIGLEFLTGELHGPHDPSGIALTVLAALSGMEREYIRDRTLKATSRPAPAARPSAVPPSPTPPCCVALHLREQNLNLRDIAARLVIAKGKKKGEHRPRLPRGGCCASTTRRPLRRPCQQDG